jgi:ribosome biogenesis GTPase / thiamine phosphate phosphatase
MFYRVITLHSNFYYVDYNGETLTCFLRANLKKEGLDVLVGDFVALDAIDPMTRTGWIVRIRERSNRLQRPKVANVDRVLILHPHLPEGDRAPLQSLDRVLTHVELAALPAVICFSKADLKADEVTPLRTRYEALGYPVLETSIHWQASVDACQAHCQDTVTVLAGLSGAGKSSLLNALMPNLNLSVSATSTRLGSHTTRTARLIPFGRGWLVDTPGFSLLKFDTVAPAALRDAFREFQSLPEPCQYADCLHRDEAGCRAQSAISAERYAHYRQFQQEAETYQAAVLDVSDKRNQGRKQNGHKSTLLLKSQQRQFSRRTHKQADLLRDLQEPDAP